MAKLIIEKEKSKAVRRGHLKYARIMQSEGNANLRAAATALGLSGDFADMDAAFGLLGLWLKMTPKQRRKLVAEGRAECGRRQPAVSDQVGQDLIACLDPTCLGKAEIVSRLLTLGLRRVRSGRTTAHEEYRGVADVEAVQKVLEAVNGKVTVIDTPTPPPSEDADGGTSDREDEKAAIETGDSSAHPADRNELEADLNRPNLDVPLQRSNDHEPDHASPSNGASFGAELRLDVIEMKPSTFLRGSRESEPESHGPGPWTKQYEGVD